MFTGIIEEIGTVLRRTGSDLTIAATTVVRDVALGDSIAVDGACMTVVQANASQFTVQVSPESFSRTTLGKLNPGDPVNLERAMSASGRFGGHIVQGHVDGVGAIESVTPQGAFALWRFSVPNEIAHYLVPKGSIAIDGISLTVVEPKGSHFSVAVIPETLAKTKLPQKSPGALVNLEIDILGKYVYHFVKGRADGGLSMNFLSEHGFA